MSVCSHCGPHCYAVLLNGTDGGKIFDEEKFCPVCKAHLSIRGICLNACQLSAASREKFSNLIKKYGNDQT